MSRTVLISHADCAGHVTPPGHPEQVARLDAVLDALADLDLNRVEAPMAARDDVLRCHPAEHIARLEAALPGSGLTQLDADTFLSQGSLAAAWRGAGAAVRAVKMVLGGEVDRAFCATRPPGHHAEATTPMGFCLFGNVAIAARHALDHHGLARVAVLDFDVHHGNGTQALLEDDPRALVVSSQQMPLWPGTGDPSDEGPHGTVLNIALAEGTRGPAFARAWDAALERVRTHAPGLILISAGFDAHADDPLAALELHEDDFAAVTRRIVATARDLCGGRVVSVLEGGYDLPALARSARAHVTALTED